jgi:ABC-type polysaccharide/polyol phosphate export permease
MVVTSRNDIWVGLRSWRLWGTLAFHDIRQRYRRSVLGPFWFTLSTALMVGFLGGLYSTILKQEIQDYLPYLAAGLVVWQLISSTINESCNSLMEASHLIKQVRLPLTVHICRVVWRNSLIMLHSLPVLIIVLFCFGRVPGAGYLFLPLGLLAVLLNITWMAILLSVVCARFRDIPPMVNNLVSISFFFTPIMWMPKILEERAWVAQYNPFFHLIELIRAPILGSPVSYLSWGIAFFCMIIGFSVAAALMAKFRDRVPVWV